MQQTNEKTKTDQNKKQNMKNWKKIEKKSYTDWGFL